ncbi:MAG TPA: hypothetical protein VNZ48_14665 [Xanthobacteraceae bacterium]|jgi:hypothetical protein|nr:hypothetical protein [Xanthobacteraceae bacterium]
MTYYAKMNVDSSDEIPPRMRFYIYPLDNGWKDPLVEIFLNNVEILSDAIGSDRLMVFGPSGDDWVTEVMRKNLGPEYQEFLAMLPAVLITDRSINMIEDGDKSLRLLVPLGSAESKFDNWSQFLTLMVKFLLHGSEEFLERLQPKEGAFDVANKIVGLKPGFLGISINLNELVMRLRRYWRTGEKHRRKLIAKAVREAKRKPIARD